MHTKLAIAITVAFGVAGCFASSPSKPVRAESGLVEGQPGKNVYPKEEPGFTKPLPRAYKIAPPVVPHSVADQFVDRSINDCFECHAIGEEVEDQHVATKIPDSHYVNPFDDTEAVDRELAVIGMRYNCSQCHVPQAAGEPAAKAVRP